MTLRMTVALLGLALAQAALTQPAMAQVSHDTVSYAYDALGRIQTITYANGTTITYSYDLAGNRLGQQVTCGSSGC